MEQVVTAKVTTPVLFASRVTVSPAVASREPILLREPG